MWGAVSAWAAAVAVLLATSTACSSEVASPAPYAPTQTASAPLLVYAHYDDIVQGKGAALPNLLENAMQLGGPLHTKLENALHILSAPGLEDQSRTKVAVVADNKQRAVANIYAVRAAGTPAHYDGFSSLPATAAADGLYLAWSINRLDALGPLGFQLVDPERGTITYRTRYINAIQRKALEKAIYFIVLRHGRTPTNLAERYSGELDQVSGLTDEAHTQLRALAKRLDPLWRAVLERQFTRTGRDGERTFMPWMLPLLVSSELRRSIQTTDILMHRLETTMQGYMQQHEGEYHDLYSATDWLLRSARRNVAELNEINFGPLLKIEKHDWALGLLPDMWEFEAYQQDNQGPSYIARFPGAESRLDHLLRVAHGLLDVIDAAHPEQVVVLSTHGETQSRILELLGVAPRSADGMVRVVQQPNGRAFLIAPPYDKVVAYAPKQFDAATLGPPSNRPHQ